MNEYVFYLQLGEVLGRDVKRKLSLKQVGKNWEAKILLIKNALLTPSNASKEPWEVYALRGSFSCVQTLMEGIEQGMERCRLQSPNNPRPSNSRKLSTPPSPLSPFTLLRLLKRQVLTFILAKAAAQGGAIPASWANDFLTMPLKPWYSLQGLLHNLSSGRARWSDLLRDLAEEGMSLVVKTLEAMLSSVCNRESWKHWVCPACIVLHILCILSARLLLSAICLLHL
ncbi:hypothetical protein EON65_05160 [archaeon]|nr:MAG: hypothetical protein EON65_05160 [archaeon]